MSSPLFRFILRSSHAWPKHRSLVARELFLRGAGQRETAAALGLSLHNVRQHAHFVQSIFEQARLEQERAR
jgi:predicted transcriptional regulator